MIRVTESVFIKSCVNPEHYPETPFADIAFAGKSNVGKSSMLNTIVNRKLLAKKSGTPGKTRLINYFQIALKRDEIEEKYFLNFVDLPGYGYARVSLKEKDSWKKMMETYFKERSQLRGVMLLVDIRHSADPKDIVMIALLEGLGIPYCLVATKSDKIPKNKIPATLKKLKTELNSSTGNIIAFSSLSKTGITEVLSWIEEHILT
jgi:GTP-binding protein